MTKVPFAKTTASNIYLSDWNLPKMDEVREKILEAFEEVILAACEDGADVRLPYIWSTTTVDGEEASDGEGGPAVLDPLIMRVGVPLGGSIDRMPSWDVDLGAFIEGEVAFLNGDWSGVDEDAELLTRMRDRLSGLVALIDKQIGTLKRKQPNDIG